MSGGFGGGSGGGYARDEPGDFLPRASQRSGTLRVDVTPAIVETVPGEQATVVVEVTNTDDVIRQVVVDVLGLDAAWVEVDEPAMSLFPDERSTALVAIKLPADFPAGARTAVIEVGDLASTDAPALVELSLVVIARDAVTVHIEPTNVITGRRATLSAAVANRGNTTLDVALHGSDPEQVLHVVASPPVLRLHPGEDGVVKLEVAGKRPIVGPPQVRALGIEARGTRLDEDGFSGFGDVFAPAVDVALATIIQRPWLSRRMLSISGLLTAAAVFALVITTSFGGVVDKAEEGQQLLAASLDADAAAAGVEPAGVGGVVSSAAGAGIDGVTVELFDVARGPLLPVLSTVTDPSGTFRFPGLTDGAYRLRIGAAGFGERWYPDGGAWDEAQDLELKAGSPLPALAMTLAGQPAAVAGTVLGDVTGASVEGVVVYVRLPSGVLPVNAAGPATSLIASYTVDKTGRFEIADLPTPGTYELIALGTGLASVPRTVRLDPGAKVDKLSLLLRAGDGVLAGRVVDREGNAVSNATIAVAAGTSVVQTLTLSGDVATAGRFEIRNLQTPGTFSLTVSVAGFLNESQTITLGAGQTRTDLAVALVPNRGVLGGRVLDAAGRGVGGVTVTALDAAITRRSASVSVGDVGTWQVGGLQVPGNYTLTFTAPGYVSQTLALDLSLTSPTRTDLAVRLSSAVASIRGVVRELGSRPDTAGCIPDDADLTDCPGRLSGVSVTLTASGVNRQTVTADIPAGAYRFDNLAPGGYTITFARTGSTPQTVFAEVAAGDERDLTDVYLERQAAITGRVTEGSLGRPNITVRVYPLAQYPLLPTATAITDNQGNYRITGLAAPETYIVEFVDNGQVRGSRQIFLQPGETQSAGL